MLDTYTAERAPVAEQIVKRANKSSREFGDLFDALGVSDAVGEDAMRAAIEERKDNSPTGAAKRAAITRAMELKNYEFNAHGVELGQFYQSSAIVAEGAERPTPDRDPELYYQLDGSRITPSARLAGPHRPSGLDP